MLQLYPMSFEEFLIALNKQYLVDMINNCFEKMEAMTEPFHTMALKYYRYYLYVGGMPEAVKNLVDVKEDFSKFNIKIIDEIVNGYFEDMSKHVENKNETLKIERLYKSIPLQLSNDSHKFQFSKIDDYARRKNYLLPLDWLLASRIIISSNKVKVAKTPLAGFIDPNIIKLFISDMGILRNLLKISFSDIILDNLSLYKGAIAENYVACELNSKQIELYYWTSNSQAEVDFLIYNKDGIIPIEVKASDNTKSKILDIYINKYNPKYAYRVSTKNFGYTNKIKSIPLYAIFCINNK